MTLAKSSKTTNGINTQNGFLQENALRLGFQPQYAASQPIERDDNAAPIKGTALLIFQGKLHSTINWNEDGKTQSAAKLALVWAVRMIDGSYQNLAKKVPYKWVQGNDLDLMVNALDAFPDVKKDSEPDNELYGDDFKTVSKIDFDAVIANLEGLRGKAYTATLVREIGKSGAIYHDIVIQSIKPRLGKDGKHLQAQEASKTDPSAVYVNWEE